MPAPDPQVDVHAELVAHHDKTLIVDFGSQVTQLIARRVREAGVYCEIAPFQSAEKAFETLKPKAVILSGGPCSVTDEGSAAAHGGWRHFLVVNYAVGFLVTLILIMIGRS